MSLVQLIYVSTAKHELSADEIKKILDTAVRRNGENKGKRFVNRVYQS